MNDGQINQLELNSQEQRKRRRQGVDEDGMRWDGMGCDDGKKVHCRCPSG